MNPDIINSVGLALDIVGVGLLYWFGLPSEVRPPNTHEVWEFESVVGEEQRWNRYVRWSRTGLAALAIGFLLQIVSNHL